MSRLKLSNEEADNCIVGTCDLFLAHFWERWQVLLASVCLSILELEGGGEGS